MKFSSKDRAIQPFIKWAGGKTQLLDEISKCYPTKIDRYVEPFLGGGAVLFDVLRKFSPTSVYASDTNQELINTYQMIKTTPDLLIEALDTLQTQYFSKTLEQRKKFYLEKRAQFNSLRAQVAKEIERASLFIFLNRTCFNGLYRVNRKGEFNVPFGQYKNPSIVQEKLILANSKALEVVEFKVATFRESFGFITKNTFVYFDPPYRPISTTSSFNSYSGTFSDDDQKELASFVRLVDSLGANFLLSNSDPKNTDPTDTFFDDLYSGFEIKRIAATRRINSNAKKRGVVSEILVSNLKKTRS